MSDESQFERYDNLIRLSFFTEIGKTITSAQTLKALIDAVMEKIGSIFAPTSWSLLLRNHRTGELNFVVAIGAGAEQLNGKILARGQGVAGWIAENGVAVISEDVAQDSRFDQSMDQVSGFVTRSIIGVPLKTRTRVFGVIELINSLDGAVFTPYDLKLLSTIADYAAIGMEKLYYIQALRKSAMSDGLTGLYNRRLLVPFIQRELDRSRREKAPFSLLFIDVDDFKLVNDSWGHDSGDEVLRLLAELLRAVIRKMDFTCRWGGDEFAVVLSGQDLAGAELVKSRILNHPILADLSQRFGVGLSIGIHEATEDSAQAVMQAVDKKMYGEKLSRVESEPEDLPDALDEVLETENGY